MGPAARPAAPAQAGAATGFPSLVAYLMNVTLLYSTSRQRESRKLTDLYFNPPLQRVGMLQWKKFDSIVAQGHAHGAEVLDALPAHALEPFRPHAGGLARNTP